MSKAENTLWVEKYRPATLENYIGNEYIKTKLNDMIQQQDIPHLLFSGKAGTGKTTAAKILVNNIDCDYLFINASDENNVDTIRNKIKGFVSSIGFKPLKIVVLDEADYLSLNGQAALRNLMETFSQHSRFILTCNYQERIIEPIVSRTQSFTLTPPSHKEVALHLVNILKEQGVQYKLDDIKTLIVTYYPDVRKIINTAQLFTKDGVLQLDYTQLLDSDVKLAILNSIFDKTSNVMSRFKNIRELIHKNGIRDFSEMYSFLYENLDNFPEKNQPNVILEIAEAQYRDSFVVDKEISFAAMIYKLLTMVN